MSKELIKTIFARRSIRKYAAEPVSEKDIKTMLEAAMAAPSASNRKPWHFIVVTDRQKLDNLARVHPYGKMLFEAPLCIAVCGDTTISPLIGFKIARPLQRTFSWQLLRWVLARSGLVFIPEKNVSVL